MKKILLFLVVWVFTISSLWSNYVDDIGGLCPKAGIYESDQWSFYKCECTSYVAWKLNQDGIDFYNYYEGVHWGNADNWDDAAADANIAHSDTPNVGDVAVWNNGTWGHVAYVESVNSDGSVNVTDYNYNLDHEYQYRTSVRADEYIHISNQQQGWVDLKGDISIYPNPVTISEEFEINFSLKESKGSKKKFEYVEVWIHDKYDNQTPYLVKRWSNVSFSANKLKSFDTKTFLDPTKGRTAGKYLIVIKGKVKNDSEFIFGTKEFEAKAIKNNIKPYAYIELFQEGEYGEVVILDAYYSYDSDGTIVKYEWKEGSTLLSTNQDFGKTFSAGTHTITLKVTDNEGATGTTTTNFTVNAYNNNTTTKDADYYVDKFYNTYKDYFGNKSGSTYTCYTDYKCQDFNTGKMIAVHKSYLYMYWYDGKWHYHGKGSTKYK